MNPKDLAKKARDKFLVGLQAQVSRLEDRIVSVEKNQNEQMELSRTIAQRVLNQGTFELAKDEIVTKIFSGAKMHLDPKDAGFVPNLVLDGDWERNITRAWQKVLKKNSTIVDIGANFGYFAVLAAQYTDRDSKTILFEANPNLIKYIKKTMVENSFEDCTIVENLALADEVGTLKLNILKDFIASSSIHSPSEINRYMHGKMKVEVEETLNVNATTLDSYCQDHNVKTIDLIKMDIEGYEDKAYAGMRGIVRKSPGITLFIEFNKDAYENPKQFYDQMLKDFGNLYLISNDGELIKPKRKSYEDVIGKADGWIMPVFSKDDKLSG